MSGKSTLLVTNTKNIKYCFPLFLSITVHRAKMLPIYYSDLLTTPGWVELFGHSDGHNIKIKLN